MLFAQQVVRQFKHLNRNIRMFFLANVLFQIGTGMFSVLYNLYIQALGYQADMNGTIVSVQSLATALLLIPIGLLGDRTSRKNLLMIGALFTGASLIGRSFMTGESSLLIFAITTGLFTAFFQIIAVPFLAENTDKAQRLQLFSYHFALGLAAQVLGSIGGGFFADLLQDTGLSEVHSLQIVLMAGGVATLVGFIPLFFVRESKIRKIADEQQAAATAVTVIIDAREDWKSILKFTFAQLLVGFGSGLVVPYLNLYFTDRFSVSLTSVGILISLGQVMTIVSMLIGPSLARRVGQVRAVVFFQMLSLPFLLLTGFTNVFIIACISFLFRQALMNAANPIQSSIMVDRVSDGRRGIANSLTQTAFMMGWATMGPVQSHLITNYGTYWGYVFTFCITGILYISASAMYYYMFRQPAAKSAPSVTG